MKKTALGIIALILSIVVSGCTMLGLSPGPTPSSTAPKLVTPPGQKQYWNDASLFGPVPTKYQEEGDKYCQAENNKTAIGYYPNPKKYDGTYFGKRGYLCSLN